MDDIERPGARVALLSRRQEEILAVATELFRVRGYHGTRMDDVAAGVALNKATVYHYFPSKADILHRLCMQSVGDAVESLRDAPEGADVLGQLTHFTQAIVGVTARTLSRAAVYFQEAPFLEQWLSEAQVKEIRELEGQFDEHITAIFARGVADGTFPDVDPRIAALGYTGMVNWVYRWYSPGGWATGDEAAADFVRLYVS
jgi:AcrR family transcriptional regulator